MATVAAENIKKAWEMKDTLCAGIVVRVHEGGGAGTCIYHTAKSGCEEGGGMLAVLMTSVRMTLSCITFGAITTRHVTYESLGPDCELQNNVR